MSAVTALCRRKPMGPSSGKAAATPSAIAGSGRLGGCGRQRVRKQSLSRSCSTRWTSRCASGVLAGVEHCLHCLFVLKRDRRAPLTNFGWPPRTKGNLRKFGKLRITETVRSPKLFARKTSLPVNWLFLKDYLTMNCLHASFVLSLSSI